MGNVVTVQITAVDEVMVFGSWECKNETEKRKKKYRKNTKVRVSLSV